MDLFNLIRASNPTKVKTGTRPRVAHEVPLLTVTASRVIEMEDPAAETDSSGVPSTIERSPMDFANENSLQQSTGGNGPEDQGQEAVAPEVPPLKNVTTMGVAPEAGQTEGIAATGPHSTHGGKSLAAMGLGMGSTRPVHASRGTLVDVSDPDPLSFADPQSRPTADVAQSSKGVAAARDPESENTSFTSMVGSPESIYRPKSSSEQRPSVSEVSTLQAHVTGEEKLKAAFKEFKHYEDNRVEQRCAEMDARLDALSIDFDEELYSYMLTAIVDVVSSGIAKGMNEGLKYGVEHGKANLSVEAIEAYDPEAEAKYIAALHAPKDLKYPIVDQLESLKDANMDVIMASLHLEKVRDHADPWACKEEILLAGAIAADVSRAKKKKKCRVVCRTHEVGSAHHARSDGVLVSVPPVSPQGLAILLADAATQTKTSEDEASPRVCTASVLCALWESLRTHPTSWVYVMKMDSESAAARVATRLCGRPSIGIFGL
nr:hypothetical protein [Tanacetum cinerariifolium]